MRLALAQLNPLVGDLAGNGARILTACHQAAGQGASLVLTPELSLWGYPPRDLLLRPSLIAQQGVVLQQLADALAEELPQLAVLVGIAEPNGAAALPNLFNAVALVQAGNWRVVARKRLLPTYDVFDEQRYFCAASEPSLLELEQGGRHWRLGLTICEDLWVEEELQGHRLAGADPVAELLPHHVDLLLNLSASPFGQAKVALRQSLAHRAATRLGCPVVYVNQVGGNDELVFDGASFVMNPRGGPDAGGAVEAGRGVVCQLACGREQVLTWDAAPCAAPSTPHPDALLLTPVPEPLEQLFRTLVLGVADYARKCGFHAALLGLSGGIDSALVAVIAAAALGAERVQGVLMPSPWSSEGSLRDAQALAARLGLATQIAAIAPLMAGFDAALTPVLAGPPAGLSAENLQSRIRGTLLMAVANQKGQLLLSTGNKSELAVGYCTLYGDMNGGLAVIGDLYKTTVFALCDWLDSPAAGPCRHELGLPADGELVGQAIREKPPSAELRPDQRDSDSLPDYAVLDPILRRYIEHLQSPEELIADGTPAELAHRVMALLRRAEFKRRQAPPLLKIGSRSFGSGWRMPIAAANLEEPLRS
ncbi:NAD+ synthase [Cyanobium sp. Aljojuca 7D2]|uniref:NAD+ synthase n=1 Tax=Cyanobium sp. Aljojuca 7D2 TaxID=2823698 RepID=UPI0020CBDDC7|nr:NAD+ synthase [Cyanobium sp. Aljojuca 7D2]MCP9891315.1 NAD+ synthase [Cyanobium sp. Aljojuca 7D2]